MDMDELRLRAARWEREAEGTAARISAAASKVRELVDAGDAGGAASRLVELCNHIDYLESSTHDLGSAASWCAEHPERPRIVKLPPR